MVCCFLDLVYLGIYLKSKIFYLFILFYLFIRVPYDMIPRLTFILPLVTFSKKRLYKS